MKSAGWYICCTANISIFILLVLFCFSCCCNIIETNVLNSFSRNFFKFLNISCSVLLLYYIVFFEIKKQLIDKKSQFVVGELFSFFFFITIMLSLIFLFRCSTITKFVTFIDFFSCLINHRTLISITCIT